MKVCEIESETDTGSSPEEAPTQSRWPFPTLVNIDTPRFFFIIMETMDNDNEIVGRYDNLDEALQYARNIANIVAKESTLKKIEVRHLGKLMWIRDLQNLYG
jgi:hypothetical protein